MLITEFYKNKELFITGGTGFLGKSLIEKLLRSCPDISKIYLLIREKRNKTPRERLQELSNDLVFERLHREQPKAFEKIIPIVGDSFKLGLGISSEDLERLKNIHIIIHGAADVRFNTDLHDSILSNTRGTYEILKLALNFKHLIAFVHVSTAYVNPFITYVNEELCEAPVDWRTAIKIAETVDSETLECLSMKYSTFPNAYSFTKNLSEQVVASFADRLPLTIVRPSIVAHASEEPEPGYLDNLNGHMGFLVAIGSGLSQITYCSKNLKMSIIPVDTITILTVIATYRRGLETIKTKKNGMDIRNLTSGKIYELRINQSVAIFLKYLSEEPFEETLWVPSLYMTSNFLIFMLAIFLINIPMALFYDTQLKLAKKKPKVMKVTRKFVSLSKVLSKFTHTLFVFQNDGMYELIKMVPEVEKKDFDVEYALEGFDIDNCISKIRNGVKKYIFKQPIKTTPGARRRYQILIYLDKILKIVIFSTVVLWLWRAVN